jgi:hypothetical protein
LPKVRRLEKLLAVLKVIVVLRGGRHFRHALLYDYMYALHQSWFAGGAEWPVFR